jgi:hypothetical protein
VQTLHCEQEHRRDGTSAKSVFGMRSARYRSLPRA